MNIEQANTLIVILNDVALSLRHLANRVPPRFKQLPDRVGENPWSGEKMVATRKQPLPPWQTDAVVGDIDSATSTATGD